MFHLLENNVQSLALLGVSVQLVVLDHDVTLGGLDHLGHLHLGPPLDIIPIDPHQLIPSLESTIFRCWSVVKNLKCFKKF